MITWLKNWANQIIIAVIIATILEMILPNGNNKKYIKMIIGLYVLFNIMQPILTVISGDKLTNLDFDYKKYFDNYTIESSTKNLEDTNSKLIEKTYLNNIKKDIVSKVEQKGYKVINCNINITNNTNSKNYANIESIQIEVTKNEKIQENKNNIKVNSIDIKLNNNIQKNENNKLQETQKNDLLKYLSNEYSIDKENIKIN